MGILVFDDADELDLVGPLEVFAQAHRLSGGVEVVTFSKDSEEVRCRGGLRVLPDHSFVSLPAVDLILVPGGVGARERASHDPATLDFLISHAQRGSVASVCTGALVLAEAGLLKGRRATTHRSALAELSAYPDVRVVEGVRFVRDGNVSTSAGVSAGIDLALDLVREWLGPGAAAHVAEQMEYTPAAAFPKSPRRSRTPR